MKIDEWISDERVRRKAQIIDLPLFSSMCVITPSLLWKARWCFFIMNSLTISIS